MSTSSLRTYLNWPSKIDPAHIISMADLELSVSLASTLVSFNDEREIVATLADKWDISKKGKISFELRKGLKWSNGEPITAGQYVAAFERAKKLYSAELTSLFDSVDSITASGDVVINFVLKANISVESMLIKLTEPMYGLLSTHKDGSLDLSRSSGPFRFVKQDVLDLELAVNSHWISFTDDLPKVIILRKPKANNNPIEEFFNDEFPNLVSGNSVQKEEIMKRIEKSGYKVWRRQLDKLFALYPSERFLKKDGAFLMQSLDPQTITNDLMAGLQGYNFADQFFPRGYILHSTSLEKAKNKRKSPNLDSISILILASYKGTPLAERVSAALEKQLHAKISIEFVEPDQLTSRISKQDYDILATGVAVADSNFEGAMSFFIESKNSLIRSGEDKNNFAARVKNARTLKSYDERAVAMRSIIIDAQTAGYVMPLYHFSSFAVAKPGVEISAVPTSNETVHYSRVRMN